MNSGIFEEWIRDLDEKLEEESCKVALIVDNCSDHQKIGGVKSVQIFFSNS